MLTMLTGSNRPTPTAEFGYIIASIGFSKSGYNLKIYVLFQKELLVCHYLCFGTEHFPQYYPAYLVFDHSQYNYFEVRYKHNMCKKTKKYNEKL